MRRCNLKVMKDIRSLIILVLLSISFNQINAQEVGELFNSAKSLVMNQSYSEALLKYKAAFEIGKGDSTKLGEAYGYTGICFEELGDVQEALVYYKKALDFKVLELSVYDKAIALTKTEKKYDLYEWMLLEKAKYFPEFEMDIARSLNSHYLRTKQYDKLMVSSEKMKQLFPNSPRYPYYQGLVLQNIGKVDSAVVVYKAALEIDANYTFANMRLGQILFERGNEVYAKKKKAYEAIAKPTRVDYSKYHKSLEEAKSIYRDAETYLLKAYENKKDANLKKMLFALYTRLRENDKALIYK